MNALAFCLCYREEKPQKSRELTRLRKQRSKFEATEVAGISGADYKKEGSYGKKKFQKSAEIS